MTGPRPDAGERVDVGTPGRAAYPTWVDDVSGGTVTVVAPPDIPVGELPALGGAVSLRWYNARGRHLAQATLASVSAQGDLLWVLDLGDVEVHQDRLYVRGGGGEPVRLSAAGTSVEAAVVDLGERSVRARFSGLVLTAGAPAGVQLMLEGERLELTGTVLRVVPDPVHPWAEVVVLFDPSEAQATVIRRHIFQSQLRARARARA